MLNLDFKLVGFQYSPLEVTLNKEDDFLKIRETLTRMGIASRDGKKLSQSCHILHKQGRYYITHFKEMFALSGKETNLIDSDIERRNTIAKLLEDWNLLRIVDRDQLQHMLPVSQIKIIPYKDKSRWELCKKYTMTTDQKYQKEAA